MELSIAFLRSCLTIETKKQHSLRNTQTLAVTVESFMQSVVVLLAVNNAANSGAATRPRSNAVEQQNTGCSNGAAAHLLGTQRP